MSGAVIIRSVTAILLLLTTLPGSANADPDWNWYCVFFATPFPGSKVSVRYGTAQVLVQNGDLEIHLQNRAAPDEKADFSGTVHDQEIVGELGGILTEEDPIALTGYMSELQLTDRCRIERIVLSDDILGGLTLVLRRGTPVGC